MKGSDSCIYCHGTGRRVCERDANGWPVAWAECSHFLRENLELLAEALATPSKDAA